MLHPDYDHGKILGRRQQGLTDLVLEPYNTIHYGHEMKRRALEQCPMVAAKRAEQLTKIYITPPRWADSDETESSRENR